ncbi:GlxA family transcriptional regulator [Azohydromonas caseinilytica]|uniref:Helix-turn-helix domain-containing protein n=1 Tax=Azohydromonas caseinilytica TaxID=2728836 RepID=A0A848F7I2_9BURK|nr:helix-turn-helix domain-containing protein [Azohydromonas caseinilytica]NML14021.1 helix-turn-helix domain-containing protein [Azohydromonas caseinilytica]
MNKAYFLVLPHVHMLDLAGPLQIMGTLGELGISGVNIQCIGPQQDVLTFQNVALRHISPLPDRLDPDNVIFVIGSKLDEKLMGSPAWFQAADWLRKQISTRNPPQVAGICTGTFLLGEAGLLDGRLCTTHHQFVQQLRRLHPAAQVVDNRICVQDGKLWTSAGVASGIDLALQLIAQSFGDHVAIQVARENVVHFRRFGNDPELGVRFRYRAHGNQLVHSMQDEISNNLSKAWTCEALARKSGFSSRHLARIFKAETGITMKRYQMELRMDLARRLITGSTLTLERIAERCGFSSMQAFRSNWNKCEEIPPSQLRQQNRNAEVE